MRPAASGPPPGDAALPVPIGLDAAAALVGDRVIPDGGLVAVDGAVPADTALLAGRIAEYVTELGRPVLTVATHDFLHPRGVRLETGADDPDAGYHRWVDHGTLHRAVLEPMTRPTRPAQVLPSLREPGTGRPTRAAPVAVPAGGVVLVHGWLVLRTELAGAFDVRVHLRADWPAVRRRTGEAGGGEHDLARPAGAWKLYQEWDFPEEVAHIVLGFDHPDRPVLLSA